tara:strand:+ start:802 stop:1455 length:654 start_codon:yes stop_codon:yes gene_type:complete
MSLTPTSNIDTHDYTDKIAEQLRKFMADDAARAEARRDSDIKKCEDKHEKKEKYWEAKLEQKDKMCNEKLEKMKQTNEEKLEKIKQEYAEKLEKINQDCDGKLEKKDKECEQLTKVQTAKIQKVQSWRKTNTEKFMNTGCDDPQVIATLAKDMGNTRFMTGDIVQDRVKLMLVNDWECAAFSKRCAQVKENMEKINYKRKHDQIDSDTGASSITELE